jgi:hypothetical protein
MYSLAQLRGALRDPSRVAAEFGRLRWRATNRLTRLRGLRSEPMVERDWDTLLLLDACRYDVFERRADLDGTLERHYSVASNTAEWLTRSFVGRTFPEVVYVTASPKYLRQDLRRCFHDVVPVWQDDWDDDLRTVPPEVMTDRVLAAHEEYPDKRVLAHYVQPHIPFVGPTGRAIPHEVVFAQTVIRQDTDQQNLWAALEAGRLDRDEVWRAYVENLDLALPAVERALDGVAGRVVVTADHGNVFGEHGLYGHPPGRHVPELVTVPWHVHDAGPRRETAPGEVRPQDDHYRAALRDDGAADRRLAALGYLDG